MKKHNIGYTTGVFDMFHIGHLNMIKRAKEQCEYLIVGVSTDELVNSYKGHYPVIPLEQRLAIVEAIRWVDKAVLQTSMDKIDAWKELHFDALFHGSEWKNTPLYNKIEQQFADLGVDVIFFEPTKGISSTILRDKIKK